MPQCYAPWVELALQVIKKWEGCKLTAYPDPATGGDPWTIGWGQTGPGIGPGVRWTQAQADAALLAEVMERGRKVDALVTAPLGSNEKAALVSLAYNIGFGNFAKSTLLRLVNDHKFDAAAAQFGRWNKANKRVLAGLTKRRADERALFLGV